MLKQQQDTGSPEAEGQLKNILQERDRVGVGLALHEPEGPTDFIDKEFQTLRPLQPAGLPAETRHLCRRGKKQAP